MPEAEHVIAADLEIRTGGEPGGAARIVEAGLATADAGEFAAEADTYVVAMAFGEMEEDVFAFDIAIRVLNRHVDAVKDAQIIETALHHAHVGPGKRVAGFEQNASFDQAAARIVQAREEHIANVARQAFRDEVVKCDFARTGSGREAPVESGIGI